MGNFDDWPHEARALPKAGGYIDPDFEKITLLAPELILLPGAHQEVSRYAELQALDVLNVHMDSLKTIDAGIETIGAALDCVRKAKRLRAQIQEEADALRRTLKDVERPSVFIITSRLTHDLNTLHTVGGASFVSELVELAGGDNIFGHIDRAYFEASKESVVVKAPGVILEFHCGESLTGGQQDAYYNDWQALPTLPAVRNARIYLITESHGLRPGPRVVEVARIIARLLHPRVAPPQ